MKFAIVLPLLMPLSTIASLQASGPMQEGAESAVIWYDGLREHLVFSAEIKAPVPAGIKWATSPPSPTENADAVPASIFAELDRAVSKDTSLALRSSLPLLPFTVSRSAPESVTTRSVKPSTKAISSGATLTVKFTGGGAADALLTPIHTSFATQELSYPLQSVDPNQNFDLNLYVLSKKPLPRALVEDQVNLVRLEAKLNTPGDESALGKLFGNQSLYVTRLSGLRLNGKTLLDLASNPTWSKDELGSPVQTREVTFSTKTKAAAPVSKVLIANPAGIHAAGDLSASVIHDSLLNYGAPLKACHEKYGKQVAWLKMGIEVQIAASGATKVLNAPQKSDDEASMENFDLRKCVATAIQKLRFPASSAGKPTKAQFEITLRRE